MEIVYHTIILHLPLSANSSTELVVGTAWSVKKVPTFLPLMMVLMAFSCMPLQMTTLTPRAMAHVAAFTLESIPPVPTCK